MSSIKDATLNCLLSNLENFAGVHAEYVASATILLLSANCGGPNIIRKAGKTLQPEGYVLDTSLAQLSLLALKCGTFLILGTIRKLLAQTLDPRKVYYLLPLNLIFHCLHGKDAPAP